MATPAEVGRSKKIKHIDCQTGPKARTDPKRVSGAVANLADFLCGLGLRWHRYRAQTSAAPIVTPECRAGP